MKFGPSNFRRAGLRIVAASCIALLASATSHAGFVTTNEAGMDTIFSQASFNGDTIDIRFGATQTIFNTSLLDIDSAAEFNFLASPTFGAPPTVRMFFVDSISHCGGGGSFLGCAFQPGSVIALNSISVAGGNGAKTMSHELLHNLGLDHVLPDNGTNLMNPTVGSDILTTAQADFIRGFGPGNAAGPLIQFDGLQRFIMITPIAVMASPVPEPGTYGLMIAGLALLGVFSRRRKYGPVA